METGTKVFVQGPLLCIDIVMPDGRSQIERETLEQIQVRYPGAEIADLEAWSLAKEKALCTEPAQITEERFWEMLEVLPPQRWQRGKDCESFELCEHTSGRITTICARFGNQYFEWQDRAGQSLPAHATHCGQFAKAEAGVLAGQRMMQEQIDNMSPDEFASFRQTNGMGED